MISLNSSDWEMSFLSASLEIIFLISFVATKLNFSRCCSFNLFAVSMIESRAFFKFV